MVYIWVLFAETLYKIYIIFANSYIFFMQHQYIIFAKEKRWKKVYNVDDLYNMGYMPEHFYNQLNGKSAQENYRRIVMNRQKKNKGILLSFIEGML